MTRENLVTSSQPWKLIQSFCCSLAVITENGVKLRLNIVDTPGYGDLINNEGWYVSPRSFYQKYLIRVHTKGIVTVRD